MQKIETVQQPLRFTPVGSYHLELKNDQSGEVQTADLIVEKSSDGGFIGKKKNRGSDGSPQESTLHSVDAGGDRLWILADGPFGGSLEFRIAVTGGTLSGYWAGPFGHNGSVTGSKID